MPHQPQNGANGRTRPPPLEAEMSTPKHQRPAGTPRKRAAAMLLIALAAATLAACASPPPRRAVQRLPPPTPPDTNVIAYPLQHQSEREIRQDRYECHLWAVRQSGFDPAQMRPTAAPAAPRVLPDPPAGHDTATGAITGAVIGAIVANPHNTGQGAAIGAAVGAVAGAASDSAREAQAQRIEDAYAERAQRSNYGNWQQAETYRRALSACLDGRGYSVR